MFKPLGSFVLIAVSAVAFSASAGAQANARRISPADSVARSAASVAQSTDCQAPATVGEDYQGLSCLSGSAGAQADAQQIDPAGLVAQSVASALQSAGCQAPATVGEDYQGLSCTGSRVKLSVVFAPSYSVGEDFSGAKIIAWQEGGLTVSDHPQPAPKRASSAAAGSN